jgi:glycosyltransferase involved in cell wall biosynthesis
VARQREVNRARPPGLVKAAVLLANAAVRDLMRHFGMRRITVAFTQNERQRADLRAAFGLGSEHLPSGHEPPSEVADPERRRTEGIILWAASLGRGKRPWLFGDLARRHEGEPLRFVLLGGHSDRAYAEQIRAALPGNVEAPGQVPFDEALAWFDRAAVLVNTSVSEGFPNTFLQAWLRGVPVLTLGIDPDGIVREHGLGEVAEDVEAMSEALRRLLADPERYARLAAHVRAFAEERFTVARVADRFVEAAGLTSGSRRRAPCGRTDGSAPAEGTTC